MILLHWFQRGLYFLFTSLLMIAPALYNRYPLVYFDSGAYMEMAVNLEPSFHRAIGYPMLMKLTGLLMSNWPIIFLQGLLLSLMLFRLVSLLFDRNRFSFHLLLVFVLAFFSSASWYAAQLMPDIFTFILSVSLLSLILEKNLQWWQWSLYGLLLFVCSITHLSHLPILLLMMLFFVVLRFVPNPFKLSMPAWSVLGVVLLSSWMFISSYNAAFNMGFGLSKASNVFITANIGEMGYLKLYLDENCDDRNTSLCDIKDQLPLETGGYLWDVNGPVQTHPGGWEGANADYAPIVHDFLTKPRYLKWFLFGAVKATFKQVFQIELGSGLQYQYGEGTSPYWPMQTHFQNELNEYLSSVQNKKDKLPLDFFKHVNYIALFLALLVLSWGLVNRLLSPRVIVLFMTAAFFYFVHAAVSGVLANVYDRLQCRVLPLFILLAMLVIFDWVRANRSPFRHLRDEVGS